MVNKYTDSHLDGNEDPDDDDDGHDDDDGYDGNDQDDIHLWSLLMHLFLANSCLNTRIREMGMRLIVMTSMEMSENIIHSS